MKKSSPIVAVLRTLFVLGILAGAVAPSPLFAQNSLRYGRNTGNGAVYLLPSGGPEGGYYTGAGTRTVASGLSASCTSSRVNAVVGETVTWFSSVAGGNGSYFYTWNGTDGLSGNGNSVTAIYSANGEKFATLTITSGNQLQTVSCGSVRIGPPVQQFAQSPVFVPAGLGASCYATPDRVTLGESATWLAVVTGSTASTTYAWDGADNLTGDRPLISRIYTSVGVKPALLTVTSGNTRVVTACTNAVTVSVKGAPTPKSASAVAVPTPEQPTPTSLQGLCIPSNTKVSTNEAVLWQAAVIGGPPAPAAGGRAGTGAYQYLWSGDESLVATSATTSKAYTTKGAKNASVTVVAGNKSIKLECTPVEVTETGLGLMAAALFGWISGPVYLFFGLILAIIIGIIFARRKKKQEEREEQEKDHVE